MARQGHRQPVPTRPLAPGRAGAREQTPVSEHPSAFASLAVSNLEDLGTRGVLCLVQAGWGLRTARRSQTFGESDGSCRLPHPGSVFTHTRLHAVVGAHGTLSPLRGPVQTPPHCGGEFRTPRWRREGSAAATAPCSSPIGKAGGAAELSFESPVPLPGGRPSPAPPPIRHQAGRKGVQPHSCLQPGVGAPGALSDQELWLCNRRRGG